MAAASAYVKTNVMGTLTLIDGAGTSLTVPYEKGDLSVDGLAQSLNELVKHEARGNFISASYGNRRYPSMSFSAFATNLVGGTSSAPGTVYEFVTRSGAYAALVPTLGAGHPMTVDVRLTIEGSNFGDSADETITLHDVHVTASFQEATDGNSLSFSGEVLGEVVHVNNTNTVTIDEIA